jgi:hypothetical protein
MKPVVGYGLAVVAGLVLLKFVFGAIWTVVKVGLLVAVVGGALWGLRRWRAGRG